MKKFIIIYLFLISFCNGCSKFLDKNCAIHSIFHEYSHLPYLLVWYVTKCVSKYVSYMIHRPIFTTYIYCNNKEPI